MNDDDILKLVQSSFTEANHKDYYAYYDEPHLWGLPEDFIQFARLLIAASQEKP